MYVELEWTNNNGEMARFIIHIDTLFAMKFSQREFERWNKFTIYTVQLIRFPRAATFNW